MSVVRAVAVCLLLLSLAAAASAATITVDTTADAAADGHCSLREAIASAMGDLGNAEGCSPGEPDGDDTIELPDGTYDFSQGGEEIAGVGALTIQPTSGASTVIVDLGRRGGLYVHGAAGGLVLRHLTLRNGAANEVDSETYAGDLHVDDVSLVLDGVVFDHDGGDMGDPSTLPTTACGALWWSSKSARATLSIAGSTFSTNAGNATAGAACVSSNAGAASVRDTTFTGNTSTGAGAGALAVSVESGAGFECVRCVFQSNAVQGVSNGVVGTGAVSLQALTGGTISMRDGSLTQNAASGFSVAKSSAIWIEGHDEGSTVTLERLLVDNNNHQLPPNTSGEDVNVEVDTGAVVTVRDSQVTHGVRNGIIGTVDGDGTALRLGQLTVDDYPDGTGVFLQIVSGTPTVALENSLLADNGTNDTLDPAVSTKGTVAVAVPSTALDLFVDQPGRDFHLTPGVTTAIDKGFDGLATSGTLDLDHHARRAGSAPNTHPDCGAYETDSLFADDFESGDLGPSVTMPAAAWSAFSP